MDVTSRQSIGEPNPRGIGRLEAYQGIRRFPPDPRNASPPSRKAETEKFLCLRRLGNLVRRLSGIRAALQSF